jgi:hypothetical protein
MKSSAIVHRSRSDRVTLCALVVLLGIVPAAAQGVTNGSTTAAPAPVAIAVPQAAPADQPPVGTQISAEPKREPDGFLPEPRIIGRGISFANRTIGDGSGSRNGFYPDFSNMVTGSGWISAGPGYRHWLFGDRAVVDTSASISWRLYKQAQARFELTNVARSRVALGTQVLWQDLTQITYFGAGAAAAEEQRSEYRMKSTDVVAYTTLRPAKWLAIGGRVGWLHQPVLLAPAGAFKRGYPDTQTLFRNDVALTMADQPSYVHGDVSITAETRDSRSHPASGGVYRALMASYTDRDAGIFSFRRYEAEAAQFVPLAGGRVVLGAHGWLVASATAAGEMVPFYLLPSLGGGNTLRAYADYRFHDRNLLLVSAESRFALLTHVDIAAFIDAGNVAPRVSGLDLDKTSYGLGVRLHSSRATFARLDVAHGAEGWRVLFRMSDPFHLSRLSRRTAAAPFVP